MTARPRLTAAAAVATLATASALHPVFVGYGWVAPVVGGILCVFGASELVRRVRAPSVCGPLLAAAAVVAEVTAAYAAAAAHVGVVPGRAALHVLATRVRQGFHDIATLPTPVPTHPGLVLITTVAVAAVALVVDLLVVTLRRAALGGLPLLAMFAVCTSVAKHGAGWLPFVLGAGGYLWLLLVDSRERVARWGRPARDGTPVWRDDAEDVSSPLAVTGRRVGVAAIAVGVLVPLAVPGLHGGVPHSGGHGLGFGSGGAHEGLTVNPIVTVTAQVTAQAAQPLLSYRTSAQSPGYLRLTALDRFDGHVFAPLDLHGSRGRTAAAGLPPAMVPGTPVATTVTVEGLAVHWLPMPQQATRVSVPGPWVYDGATGTVFSASQETQGLQYDVESVTANPGRRALEQATTSSAPPIDLQVPNVSDAVRRLTAQVVRGARTPLDRAVALQAFLTGPRFTYDLHARPAGDPDALGAFLLRTHRGFCQQFASAMVVMARLEHIPARVAVGFTRGDQQPDGSWLVTTRDAHAWPELYFDGFGWLPFEPTPRADGQATAPAYSLPPLTTAKGGSSATDPANPSSAGSAAHSNPATSKNQRFDAQIDGRGTGALPRSTPRHTARIGSTAGAGLAAAAGALLLLLLLLPATVRVVGRRRRWRRAQTPAERAAAAWAELRATAIDAGVRWSDGLTPRGSARVLRAEAAPLAGADVRALDRLVHGVEQAWYAAGGGRQHRLDAVEDDVEALRVALFAESPWRVRVASRIWPRSALLTLHEAASRVWSGFDAADRRLDAAAGRVRRRWRAVPAR